MMRLTPKSAATAVLSLVVIWLIWTSTGQKSPQSLLSTPYLSTPSFTKHTGNYHAEEVKAAFQHAWNGYSKYCFGQDALHPVSNTCDNDFGGWGVTAIDALSTAIIMEKEDIVLQILRFISTLDWNIVKGGTSVQLFEVTIRHFGGMISAYDLLNGPFAHIAKDDALRQSLYNQMVNLGDVLVCGFKTPSGVPRNWVNPSACETDSGRTNSVAGAGSLILEFQRLSDITGNTGYGDLAKKAEAYLLDPQPKKREPFPGLLTSFLNIEDGKMVAGKGGWGSLSDSFYEYLIKAYVYDSIGFAHYLERWKLAADSTIRHIASHPFGHPEWTLLPQWDGSILGNTMDSLTWFTGGNFILGGMVTNNQTLVDFGLSITDTGGALFMSTPTKLGGEFVWWTDNCKSTWGSSKCTADTSVQFSTKNFILRPELLESWYYAYRATKDDKYKAWAWESFQGLNRVSKTSSGFAGISDVTAANGGGKIDKQESFLYAEVLKYLYLIFSDDETAPYHVQDSRTGAYNGWVLNTEAHPLRVAGPHV